VPEKGVDVLVRAYAAAFPDGGPGLTVIGSGEQEQELRQLAAGLSGVDILGQLPRAEALARVRGARALVVPSRWYEVFPRTVVEAYALGVPVVASRLGSLAEIVRDGDTGLLARPGDAEDLGRRLALLARSDELSLLLGASARRAYEARYSPDVTTAALLEIYAEARSLRGLARPDVQATSLAVGVES
jgi:glycosyltransferase involved in cell wall biosynthesis